MQVLIQVQFKGLNRVRSVALMHAGTLTNCTCVYVYTCQYGCCEKFYGKM